MALSEDELSLLIVAPFFVVALAIWAFVLHLRGIALLRTLEEKLDPALWEELGAPSSIPAAMRDPKNRWWRFIRGGEYRKRLSPELVELIDDYRNRTSRMLVIFAIAAALLLWRYWPLLRPDFL